MDGLFKSVVRRLPLAEAVLRSLEFVCHSDFLEQVFQRYRGRSYEKIISFTLFVQLIADSLVEFDGSGRKSFQRAKAQEDLKASPRAVYGKLSRLPIELSLGFLAESTARLREIFPVSRIGASIPRSLRGMEVLVHDGKKIKHVAKRLKALRKVRGHVLGGKLVVTLSLNSGMAVVAAADPDGEVSDTPLLPNLLEQVHRWVPGPRLHVADRLFCDLNQPQLFTTDPNDHFLVRWNRRVQFHRDRNCPIVTGIDDSLRMYKEEWGWIGQSGDPRRRYVRRIWLKRPGQEDVILITNLLDREKYPAGDLLTVYLERWGIERMFQQVTEVFQLKSLIGGTPQATVFQAAFCFLLYNLIQVMRAYVAEGQKLKIQEISSENLFYDTQRQLIAWNMLLRPADTVRLLATTWTAAHLARRLRELLHGQWTECWRKASRKKPTPHPNRKYLKGGHTSVYRLLIKAKKRTQSG